MIAIQPLRDDDRAWLANRWETSWGGLTMVSRGKVHRLEDQAAFIARIDGERAGSLTYWREGDEIEITSLESLVEGRGVGSALLEAIAAHAIAAGAKRIWLITTNDNLNALGFYQKRGYRLAELFPGAVDAARAVKPTIPLLGDRGIPIRDELLLERRF
jgi:ribosomal protein S18 acetylase RimI-like enzyme